MKSWAAYLTLDLRDKKPAEPLKRAHLCLTRMSYRMLDYDGLVGSMKPVVDGLVAAGIISDDSWTVTDRWEVHQSFRPKKSGDLLVITVREVSPI